MTKKLVLALGCLALLATFTGAARADLITIGFGSSTKLVDINMTGLTAGPGKTLTVSDTKTNVVSLLPGFATLSTGAATSYVTGFPLDAIYGPGGSVLVTSALCVTGGGVCLTGTNNSSGAFFAASKNAGSFQGLFTVTYVDPYITSLFGEPNAWIASSGSDSITVGKIVIKSATDATGTLGGGTITFETVPEPGTLALFGSGILGLAGLIRRKL